MEIKHFYAADDFTGEQCVLLSDHIASHAYDEAKERELFEVFAVEHYLILTRGEIRDYYYPHTHCAWTAWIACAKSRARSAE